MKTTTFKSLFGSLLVASALIAVPASAFAAHGTTTPFIHINGEGTVRVWNAEVTSVSGTIINAVTRFKNSLINWAFTTNASTTIAANNSLTASTTDIQVGDRIKVAGSLTAVGSTLSVQATKIKDLTSMTAFKTRVGTVQSVNTSNGTFVLKSNDKLITVQTNASTTFSLGTGVVQTLTNLPLNSKVTVAGAANTDTTFITASKIVLKTDSSKDWKKEWKNAWKDKKHGGKHGDRH